MYAVIEDSGQQFRVCEGDVLNVDLRGDAEEGAEVEFARVLLIVQDADVKVGTPLVAKAKVLAEVVDPAAKGEKLHVHHWRRRKASRTRRGHRQKYTQVRITKIVA